MRTEWNDRDALRTPASVAVAQPTGPAQQRGSHGQKPCLQGGDSKRAAQEPETLAEFPHRMQRHCLCCSHQSPTPDQCLTQATGRKQGSPDGPTGSQRSSAPSQIGMLIMDSSLGQQQVSIKVSWQKHPEPKLHFSLEPSEPRALGGLF